MDKQLGKYALKRKLAVGGMAEIWLAEQQGPAGFSKTLVIKRILPHLADDEKFVQMFLDEARLAAKLEHPNIVGITDLGEVDGSYFIAMEYIDGPDLDYMIERALQLDTYVPLPITARIIADALSGLHYAHNFVDVDGTALELVHRDISPHNVLVNRAGMAKIVDFGVAKAATSTHKTQTGAVKGKFAYMSPEQIANQDLDGRSDLFAMGIVLYELATNHRPFGDEGELMAVTAILTKPPTNPREIVEDFPPEMEHIIMKSLAKDRDDRYASAQEMQKDLENFIQQSGEFITPSDVAAYLEDLFSDQPSFLQGETAPPAPPRYEADANSSVESSAPMTPDKEETPPPPSPQTPTPSSTPEAETSGEKHTRDVPVPVEGVGGQSGGMATPRTGGRQTPSGQAGGAPTGTPSGPPPEPTPAGGGTMREDSVQADESPVSPPTSPTTGGSSGSKGLLIGIALVLLLFIGAGGAAVAYMLWGQDGDAGETGLQTDTNTHTDKDKQGKDKQKQGGDGTEKGQDKAAAKEFGAVILSTSPSTKVYTGDKLQGETPANIKLPVGEQTLTLKNESEGINHELTLTIRKGEVIEKQKSFKKGNLKIAIKPPKLNTIWLDGKIWTHGVEDPIELYEGQHVVKIKNQGTQKKEKKTVTIEPDKTKTVEFDLK